MYVGTGLGDAARAERRSTVDAEREARRVEREAVRAERQDARALQRIQRHVGPIAPTATEQQFPALPVAASAGSPVITSAEPSSAQSAGGSASVTMQPGETQGGGILPLLLAAGALLFL